MLAQRHCNGSARIACLLVILFLNGGRTLAASSVTPFASRNQNPFIQIFGLPFAEPTLLTPSNRLYAQFNVEVANSFSSDTQADDSLVIDGETYRLTGSLRYGMTNRIEVGLDVPYVHHTGGALDTFIDAWHDAFGFPDKGRDEVARNRLLYHGQRHGRDEVLVDDDTGGIGDVTLSVGWRLLRAAPDAARALGLRLNVKLPTGSHRRLHGSGSTDVALRLVGQERKALLAYHLGLYGAAGLLVMGNGDVLPDQQRNMVGFGTVGIAWDRIAWMVPKVQLNWHSPFFDDRNLRDIASWSAQLTVGGTLHLTPRTTLDLALTEDVVVDTSPDLVLQATLRHLF